MGYAAPGNSAVGDSATQGTSVHNPRADHKHGREAFAGTGDIANIAATEAAGTAATVPHGDHVHSFPARVVATVSSDQGPTSGTTELVVASQAVTFDGVSTYAMTFDCYNITFTVATDTFFLQIYDGPTAGSGTKLQEHLLVPNGATNLGGRHITAYANLSAGSHTITARLLRNSGTGTASIATSAGAAGRNAHLVIELL